MRALLVAIAVLAPVAPAVAQPDCHTSPRNVILMIADGVGFNGWMGADYAELGRTGGHSYQQPRPDGTRPVVLGVATQRLVREGQSVADPGYDPSSRWSQTFFSPVATGSAESSTALHSGRKTLEQRINVGPYGERFLTAFHRAEAAGRSTGVVTSVQAAHATPAGAWARVDDRTDYAEIFRQLTDGGLDVVFGAGHPYFNSAGASVVDSAADFQFVGGRETWDALAAGTRNSYVLIDRLEQFQAVADGNMQPNRVVGIAPVRTSLQFGRAESSPPIATSPSLELMSRAALQIIGKDPDGFFITIEGGAMDWANHANNLTRFLEEQSDFNRAVTSVIDWVETYSSWNETLLIVTADHETGGLWGGDSWVDKNQDQRFNISDGDEARYHTAPIRTEAGARPDLVYSSGDHTNDLVPLWATGSGASSLTESAQIDEQAKALWGEAYGWDGSFIDITSVSTVFDLALGLHCR